MNKQFFSLGCEWVGGGSGFSASCLEDHLERHTSFVHAMKGENETGVRESRGETRHTVTQPDRQSGSGPAHQLFDETRADRADGPTLAWGFIYKAQDRHVGHTHNGTYTCVCADAHDLILIIPVLYT